MSSMFYVNPADDPTLSASRSIAVTPMIADILAIEKLYGDTNALRTGDTVYGFNSTAGGFYDEIAGRMTGNMPGTYNTTGSIRMGMPRNRAAVRCYSGAQYFQATWRPRV